MRKKEKTRPGVTALGRAKGKRRYQQIDNTIHHPKIASLLLSGQENAIPRRELERITGLDGRKVRLLIESERRSGTPILSDCSNGYYLPGNQLERDACVRSLRHRARQIMITAKHIEGPRKTVLEGQLTLKLEGR